MLRILSLLCLCMMCVGCASLNVQSPTAKVTGMDLRDIDSRGFTMDFAVDLGNPNAVALPLAAVDYKLDVAGASIATGQVKPGKSIPANASQQVTVPVRLSYSNLIAAEEGIRLVGWNIPYKLAGDIAVDTGNPLTGQVRIPLQYSGQLALRKLLDNPMIILQNPAARRLAESAAQSMLGGQPPTKAGP